MRQGDDDDDGAGDGRQLFTADGVLPTSGFGRLRRVAGAAARTALGGAWGRLTGRDRDGWGALDPQAIENLVRTLGQLKGLPMKLGQILSFVDDSLPPEAQRMLAFLQTQSARAPFSEIEATIREELGSAAAEALLAGLVPEPVASASIGQVHRGVLADGTAVAVKVQYQGIEAALRAELDAAGSAARIARVLAPGANVDSYVTEVRERLLAECDYGQEAAWQQAFGEHLASHPVLRVPRVHQPFSGRRVLTTTWHEGAPLDRWLARAPSAEERNRAGVALYEFYIGALYRFGLFNADPHPGNYLFTDDAVVVLDFGCVRAFSRERVQDFVALREAVLVDEPNRIRAALVRVGASDPEKPKLYAAARTLLRAFFAPMLEDRVVRLEPSTKTRLGDLLADKRSLLRLGLPGELIFLFRIKFGLYAVLARIGAEANWHALERAWQPVRE